MHVLGPELIFVIHVDLVKFVIAVARLVCPDLLWLCKHSFRDQYFGIFQTRSESHVTSELKLES